MSGKTGFYETMFRLPRLVALHLKETVVSALNWFKRILERNTEAPEPSDASILPPDDATAELGGLNFMTAIEAHIKWKSRLEDYVNGSSSEDLKAEAICRDDQCPLGKWIYSSGGEQFGSIDTFGEMKHQHTLFHQHAGAVVETAQAGRSEEALRLLQYGDYGRVSEQVKRLLVKLYMQLNVSAER